MQNIMRKLVLVALASLAMTAFAQVQQARGKASVMYQGKAASASDKSRATMAAQIRAVEAYYAEAGQSEAENFDAVREKILADPDRYILESTVLAEDDLADRKQYTVTVRVSLNVANLRNAMKSNSAVARAGKTDKSPLAFIFVSRQVETTRSFDDRVYKRFDEAVKNNATSSSSERGAEGESVRRGQVETNASTSRQTADSIARSRTEESGGSTLKRSGESTWRVLPSNNFAQVFGDAFGQAGFKVREAAFIENQTGGHFKVSTVESDYRSGMDLKSSTLQSMVLGMKSAQIPYLALCTLDVGMAGTDPNTGLVRVSVTVNARILDVTASMPDTIASVGPIPYAGVGPTEDEARINAQSLAARGAARELISKASNLGLR